MGKRSDSTALRALSNDILDTLYGVPSTPLTSFFLDLDQISGCEPARTQIPSPRFGGAASVMSLDITETTTDYFISANLPGMTKDDIKVNVLPSNQLEITSERKAREIEGTTTKRQERFYGSVTRQEVYYARANENNNTDYIFS